MTTDGTERIAAIEAKRIALQIDTETAALAREFGGIVNRETVARIVHESIESLGRAEQRDFVPVFAGRFARERLRALAQADGAITKPVPEILYVCIHNAGRSQMAAVLTKHLGGDQISVRSAGSTPGDEINSAVVAVMTELGLDMSQEFPKPLTDEVVQAADVVITMGCGDACPVYPGKRYLDWELDDPAGQPVEVVRRIRDDIRDRVIGLLAELNVPVKK